MDRRGQGHVVDMLVFALMVTLACSLLVKASPVESRAINDRYAANLAQSILLTLQNATADEFGGLEYSLDLRTAWGPSERKLKHKTLAQLLVEDALCNLRAEINGREVAGLRSSQDLDNKVHKFLTDVLSKLIGGRFDYSLTARAESLKISSTVRVYFETSIKSLSGEEQRQQICSETIAMSLPIPKQELVVRLLSINPIELFQLEPEIAVEITLSLWSR
ncbi:MAG: hypothetical protein QMC89_00860 [Candidatus Hodarchaeaceae archaeon]|nr:hypothetical protein [Candidatus Hodarchaeaceae archaeon]